MVVDHKLMIQKVISESAMSSNGLPFLWIRPCSFCYVMRAVAWRCREEWWRTVEIYIYGILGFVQHGGRGKKNLENIYTCRENWAIAKGGGGVD